MLFGAVAGLLFPLLGVCIEGFILFILFIFEGFILLFLGPFLDTTHHSSLSAVLASLAAAVLVLAGCSTSDCLFSLLLRFC